MSDLATKLRALRAYCPSYSLTYHKHLSTPVHLNVGGRELYIRGADEEDVVDQALARLEAVEDDRVNMPLLSETQPD